jgi:general secretion pathway protein I
VNHAEARSGRSAASGFSLLETLVALVILSLALGTLYQAAAGATRNIRVAEQYTRAVALAESMLSAHSYVVDPNMNLEGEFGEFSWQVLSWPVPDPSGAAAAEDAALPVQGLPLQYLQVWVRWPGPSKQRELDLLTVVPLQGALE